MSNGNSPTSSDQNRASQLSPEFDFRLYLCRSQCRVVSASVRTADRRKLYCFMCAFDFVLREPYDTVYSHGIIAGTRSARVHCERCHLRLDHNQPISQCPTCSKYLRDHFAHVGDVLASFTDLADPTVFRYMGPEI